MTERFETRTVHIGHVQENVGTVKATPIYQTSVFAFPGLEEVEELCGRARLSVHP